MDLKKIPTCKIVEELASRDSVDEYIVDCEQPIKIKIGGEKILDTTGHCRIFHVYD